MRRPVRNALSLFAAMFVTVSLATGLPAAATTDPGETDGPGGNGGLNQVIDPNQAQATDQVVLEAGHIDYGPTLSTGEWRMQIHDDTQVPQVWRNPADVVIKVNDHARLTVPDDPAYEFLGAPAGTEAYVVPQTQHPEVIWTGWNTQEPQVLASVDLGVTMRLVGFDGPGDLSVYLQSGNFGAPQVLYSIRQPLPQQTWIELNTHSHANWVFTAPGTYLVAIEFEADLRTGERVTARDVLRFSVGSATPIEEARTAVLGDEAIVDSDSAANAAAPDATNEVPMLVWIGAGVVGAALIVAVLVMVAANARMRRRVREARAARAAQAAADDAAFIEADAKARQS